MESLKDVEYIECGGGHSFCRTVKGEIYSWGFNNYGQQGIGNNQHQNTPIQFSAFPQKDILDIKCAREYTLILTSDQCVYYSGRVGTKARTCTFSFLKLEELSEITIIECGDHHSIFIDNNNNMYVFGDNRYGQLGLGDTVDRLNTIKHPLSNIIGISKGGNHTFVKTSNNETYAFGKNSSSQLGIKTRIINLLSPIKVFEDNEDIWCPNIKSKAKSARSILPIEDEETSQSKKKQNTN